MLRRLGRVSTGMRLRNGTRIGKRFHMSFRNNRFTTAAEVVAFLLARVYIESAAPLIGVRTNVLSKGVLLNVHAEDRP